MDDEVKDGKNISLKTQELVETNIDNIEVGNNIEISIKKKKKTIEKDLVVANLELIILPDYVNRLLSVKDITGYAENFTGNKFDNGFNHLKKRVNLFEIICKIVNTNRNNFKGYEFPSFPIRNNFKAEGYTVKHIYTKKSKEEEYAHISLLNKIVLSKLLKKIDNKKVYSNIKLDGMITINHWLTQEETLVNLNHLLNVCDLVDKTVNLIDGVMEEQLRVDAVDILNKIKTNEIDVKTGVNNFKKMYKDDLTDLMDTATKYKNNNNLCIDNSCYKNNKKYSNNKDYNREEGLNEKINSVCLAKGSLLYIKGMIEAVS